MLLQQDSLLDIPIMSLQTGSELSKTSGYIIDPRRLAIIALYCVPPTSSEPHILHVSDIREVSPLGYIVDGIDKLMTLDNLVRLQEIIDMNFELIGIKVLDDMGQKIGKVSDFNYDDQSFLVEQLAIKPPIFRDMLSSQPLIHRKQIASVTPEKIVVYSPNIKSSTNSTRTSKFINPFQGHTQPETESFRTDRTSS